MKFLCEIRKQKGLSQEKLAKSIGINKNAIARYERGEVSPSIERANQIAKVLNVTLDDLMNGPSLKSRRTQATGSVLSLLLKDMNYGKRIKNFEYGTWQVCTVEKDGEVCFVAKDVCDILGLENSLEALRGLDADELVSVRVTSGGQKREVNAVNESGLYNLIFKSHKPEAKQFRRWVTHEVLPDIRKHGVSKKRFPVISSLIQSETA